MRVAILGRTHWLLDSAERIAAQGDTIALVATASAAPQYRVREADFADFAQQHGAPFFNAPDVNGTDFVAALQSARAEIGISVNWPTLVRHQACEAMPLGILNAHAGDLPRYRGNACPNWAILNGEPDVGLCVHAMDPNGLDTGPVYARALLPLTEHIYIADIYAWMDAAVPDLFVEAIAHATMPGFVPKDQQTAGVRSLRAYPRRPEDGRIDWRSDADAIARLVRASSRPFAGAFTHLESEERVVIWRARVARLNHDILAVPGQIVGRGSMGGPLVACGKGVVDIEEGERSSGRALPSANRYRFGGSVGAT